MVLTMYGRGSPQSTSQTLSVRAYEITLARMIKPPDLQFGIRFSTWNGGGGGGGCIKAENGVVVIVGN